MQLRATRLTCISNAVRRAVAPPAFTPLFFFSNNEQGIWLDPSDFSTMFQDAAGTTPVTAVEQPVGRILDKSRWDGRGTVNRIRNSAGAGAVVGTPGTLPTNWSILGSGAGTLTTQVVGVGIENGINYVDLRASGTTSTTGFGYAFEPSIGGPAAIAGQIFTGSTYLAIVGGSTNNIAFIRAVALTGRTSTGVGSGDNFNTGDQKSELTSVMQRFSSTATLSSASTVSLQPNIGIGFASGVPIDITLRIGLPQLELGSTATAPQINSDGLGGPGNHATQATATSRPILRQDAGGRYYLFFDGIDDSLVTGTITPGTDKVQVFAGVRKLSDAAAGILLELSATVASSPGSFYLAAPESSTVRYSSFGRGTVGVSAAGAATILAAGSAPDTAVLTATHDIAGDLSTIRRNGVDGASGTADKGSGNFLAYPFFIGRRNQASLPFNGHLYQLVSRFGPNLPIETIQQAETFFNQKTGAY